MERMNICDDSAYSVPDPYPKGVEEAYSLPDDGCEQVFFVYPDDKVHEPEVGYWSPTPSERDSNKFFGPDREEAQREEAQREEAKSLVEAASPPVPRDFNQDGKLRNSFDVNCLCRKIESVAKFKRYKCTGPRVERRLLVRLLVIVVTEAEDTRSRMIEVSAGFRSREEQIPESEEEA